MSAFYSEGISFMLWKTVYVYVNKITIAYQYKHCDGVGCNVEVKQRSKMFVHVLVESNNLEYFYI